MYRTIVNPITGRKVSVTGKLGQSIIRNYLNQVGGVLHGDNGVDNMPYHGGEGATM